MNSNWKIEYLKKLYQDFPDINKQLITNAFDDMINATNYEYYDRDLNSEIAIYEMTKTVLSLVLIVENDSK